MKKALLCVLIAIVLAVAAPPLAREIRLRIDRSREAALYAAGTRQDAPAVDAPSYAEQLAPSGAQDTLETTLYFRFGQTQVLGMQRALLDIRRDETVASLIVKQLLEGPDAAHAGLSGLFPQGTEVISVSGDEQTAFVTLSSAFLGRPDGAPHDWEESAEWQEEAALRRRLAVQSIVLALTENARYQRVQLYVADSDDDVPRRVELFWFDTAQMDAGLVLGPCGRDETLLLTPRRALEMILSGWQSRDWAALYALLFDEAGMPSLSAFEQEMAQLDATLLFGEVSAGTVSFDGQSATLVLDAQVRLRSAGDAQLVRESVPLKRVKDNWAMDLDTLRALMVRD